MTTRPHLRRRRGLLVAGGAVGALLIAFVLYWFQPQKLVIDEHVDEALPGLDAAATLPLDAAADVAFTGQAPAAGAIAGPAADGSASAGAGATAPGRPRATSAAKPTTAATPKADVEPRPPRTLAEFRAVARSTGRPRAFAVGKLFGLEHGTSGKALAVALPDGSVVIRLQDLRTSNGPDVHVVLSHGRAHDGDYDDLLELGHLKGNIGSQNYAVPPGTDLAAYRSVVIWCERFSAAFGAADLALPA